MKLRSPEELYKMSLEELNEYNAEKTLSILNLIINDCQKYKALFKSAPKKSNERNMVMSVAMAFHNLLSQKSVENEINRIHSEAEIFDNQIKTNAH